MMQRTVGLNKTLHQVEKVCVCIVLCVSFFFPCAHAQTEDTSKASPEEPAIFTHKELGAFSDSFVLVKFFFKRSEEAVVSTGYGWDEEEGEDSEIYEGYIQDKRPIKMIGIAIRPDLVIVPDTPIDERYLEYVKVEDLKGGASNADRYALCVNTPALLIKPREPAKMTMSPVQFVEFKESLSERDKLFEVIIEENWNLDSYNVTASPVERAAMVKQNSERESLLLTNAKYTKLRNNSGIINNPSLLVNKDKQPVGIALRETLPLESGKPPLWRGNEILGDTIITMEALKTLTEKMNDTYRERIPEIKITFRQKAKQSDSLFGMFSMPYIGEDEDDIPKELYCYGIPVSSKRLFVPKRIQREHAKVIDKIIVTIDGKEVEGKFYGAYEDLASFLITLDKPILSYSPDWYSIDELPYIQPLFTLNAQRKFGGKYIGLNYTRCTGWMREYKDIPRPITISTQTTGKLYVDVSGKIRGISLEIRKEDEEEEMFRRGHQVSSYYYGFDYGREQGTVFAMNDLVEHFASPSEHFDTTIVSLSEEEEERKMWLGLEFEPMTEELAKSLSVEKPTKDGKIGLIVSMVYPNSPAAKMGLQGGDILLKIKEPEKKEPIELKQAKGFEFDFDFSGIDIPDEFEAMGYNLPKQKPWKTRKNLITDLLEVIGEGKQAELTYLRDNKNQITTPFTLEKAPQDFDSAKKYKDDDIGLTVKEVTYEVRNALMLPEELNAVVVSKVEEGSPAAVARIELYDLILKVAEQEVANISTFERIITDAKKKRETPGKITLRFTLQQLDKTRFADLTMEQQ